MSKPETIRIARTVAATLAVTLAVAAGCDRREPPEPGYAKTANLVMGTNAAVTAVADDDRTARAAVDAAYARFDDVNRLMSDYVADSEIGRLNAAPAGQWVDVASETFTCLKLARAVTRRSGGAFDVTCRPLVRVWKEAAEAGELPTDAQLAEARARVGNDKWELDEDAGRVRKLVEGVEFDLGGIAKGYALDLAAERMESAGADGALVDIGGDVLAVGENRAGAPWRVGVRHPFAGDEIIVVLALSDRAVATSGVQQRFHEIGGRRYSHIIDPRTGRPAEQSPSVTVVASDGATADAWATVLSVLSVAEGQTLVSEIADVEVLWITGSPDAPVLQESGGFAAYVAK